MIAHLESSLACIDECQAKDCRLAEAPTVPEPISSVHSASTATSSPLDATPTALPPSTSRHLSAAAIAGIAIGPVLLALLVAAMLWLLWRRKARKKLRQGLSQPQEHSATSDPGIKLPIRMRNRYAYTLARCIKCIMIGICQSSRVDRLRLVSYRLSWCGRKQGG